MDNVKQAELQTVVEDAMRDAELSGSYISVSDAIADELDYVGIGTTEGDEAHLREIIAQAAAKAQERRNSYGLTFGAYVYDVVEYIQQSAVLCHIA